MTSAQLQLRDFIRAYMAEHRIPPSYDEMRAEMGLKSKSGVHRMVKSLVAQGELVQTSRYHRSIKPAGELRCRKCGTAMERYA